MGLTGVRRVPATRPGIAAAVTVLCAASVLAGGMSPRSASVATTPVSLGTAANFAVLAGSTITNTGPTIIAGDLGLSPGSAVTGFPPGQVNGTIHIGDAAAESAKADLTTAYNAAAGTTTTATVPTELGGTTLATGVYDSAAGTFSITGTLTLDGLGDPDAVFIFKTASTLVTASASAVNLINGARAANVFWQVGSSATLGTNSTLEGTVLALTSITATTGVAVTGRLLAINGAVTLDTNTVSTAGQLSITAAATADLAGAAPGGTITGRLGPVTVDADGFASWTATVSATSFTTGGDAPLVIANSAASYWAGPVTTQVGTGTATSGQLTAPAAESLSTSRTAFTMTSGVEVTIVTWNPTLVIAVPLPTVAGSYTGTVTHSVA
jgi:hypothetical protein